VTDAIVEDPLFGEAGKYTASWSTHDRALGTTKLSAILRQLPGLIRICLRLSWGASRSGTATVIGCQLATGAFSAFGLLAVNGVMRALLSSGLTADRIRAAFPALIVAAVAAGANRVASAVSTGVQTWLEAAVQDAALEELLQASSDVELNRTGSVPCSSV
jgi:ATP-binding cassette, subfamily B, bacterial